MELVLTRQSGTQVLVSCDNQPSHYFDLNTLVPNDDKDPPHPLDDPIAYGKAVYRALFLSQTPARQALEYAPERILLVSSSNDLDTIPWEYVYGRYGSEVSEGFLVLDCHFIRGLPLEQRID